MVASTPVLADQARILSEIRAIQKSLFEQASNYTKLVLGLAYAGLLFCAAFLNEVSLRAQDAPKRCHCERRTR